MNINNFKSIEDLYEKDQSFRGFLDSQIKKQYDNGEVYYLKPVNHHEYEIPVTLIITDYSIYYPIIQCNHMVYAIGDTLIEGGGAFGMMCFGVPELFDNQINSKMGYLIIIDKRIYKYVNDSFDQILAHEYYHALCDDSDSIRNAVIKEYGKTNTLKTTSSRINYRPEEELAADNFSLKLTGKKPKVRKLINYTLNECEELRKLPSIAKWFIKFAFYVNLIMNRRFY